MGQIARPDGRWASRARADRIWDAHAHHARPYDVARTVPGKPSPEHVCVCVSECVCGPCEARARLFASLVERRFAAQTGTEYSVDVASGTCHVGICFVACQGWKLFELRRRRTGVSEESDLRKRVDPRMASLLWFISGASLFGTQRCYRHGMETFRIDQDTDDEYGERERFPLAHGNLEIAYAESHDDRTSATTVPIVWHQLIRR